MWTNLPLFPERASTLAGDVDALYIFLVGLSIFFSVLIAGLLVAFSLRYRRRSNEDRPADIEGSLRLELFWTGVPLAIVLVIFAWGAKLYARAMTPPPGAMDVYVTGKQWMWKLQHPTGQREINELHVPLGTPVRLTMISEDVIHSFFVPAFRMKMDVLPGRFTTTWFEATELGEFHLFCTEYCGTKHSEMVGRVIVMDPVDYREWLAGAPVDADPVAAGAALFAAQRCDTCHGETSDLRGPALAGLFGSEVPLEGGGTVVADEDYLRESILEPRARLRAGYKPLMPTYAGQLTEEQVISLIAYLKSLDPKSTRTEGAQ